MYQDEYKFAFNVRPEADDPLARAIAASQNAIKADPTSQTGYTSLASAHYFATDLEQFHAAAERGLSLNPNNSLTLAYLGLLIATGGDWERGIALMDKAVYLNPNHPSWYHAIYASRHYRDGNFEAALLSAKRRNQPGVYWHHVYLATIYAQLGRVDEARESVAEIVALYPGYADVARADLEKWFKDEALVSAMMDDLKKAGLFDEPEAPSRPVIAVLPFTNMSGDPEQEYFADGIAEDILTRLTRFPDLAVIARNSTFRYKGQSVDVREIGADLGANYVLEGSVRRAGDLLRVTGQLLRADDGSHVWADSYERSLSPTNLFEIQDDITQRVVGAIAGMTGAIRRTDLARSRNKAPESLSAYECVLRAYEFYRDLTIETHLFARTCLEITVEAEPGYAEALAFRAFIEQEAYSAGFNFLPESLEIVARFASEAVAADPMNQNAQLALARTYFFQHDLASFESRVDQVLALNPNNAQVLASLGLHLSVSGRWEPGLKLLERAIELNPNHPGWYVSPVTLFQITQGDYQSALYSAQRVQAIMPDFFGTHQNLAIIYGHLGRNDDAKAAVDRLLELAPGYPSFARSFWKNWNNPPDLMERSAEGLSKAGLVLPDEPMPVQ